MFDNIPTQSMLWTKIRTQSAYNNLNKKFLFKHVRKKQSQFNLKYMSNHNE